MYFWWCVTFFLTVTFNLKKYVLYAHSLLVSLGFLGICLFYWSSSWKVVFTLEFVLYLLIKFRIDLFLSKMPISRILCIFSIIVPKMNICYILVLKKQYKQVIKLYFSILQNACCQLDKKITKMQSNNALLLY